MPALMPMDIHAHSDNSPDGGYKVDEMCGAAIDAGIDIFAITDHYDLNSLDVSFSAVDSALAKSVADTLRARERFGDRLNLLVGVELGQPLEKPAKAEAILDSYPFDFVLGSLHNAPGRLDIYFYDPTGGNDVLADELEAYFLSLLDIINWGRFDSAAHITYPFRYIYKRHGDTYPYRHWDDYLEAAVKALAEKGLALEINTSNPAFPLPEARWIKRFKELGGEKVTLGSDAHSPRRVGTGITEGVSIASEAGFDYLCYFVKREAQYIKL